MAKKKNMARIDFQKMEKELISEYPEQEEDILEGIKALRYEYDSDEQDWAGKERSANAIDAQIKEMGNKIEWYLIEFLQEMDDYEEKFEEHALPLYQSKFPKKCDIDEKTGDLKALDKNHFKKWKEKEDVIAIVDGKVYESTRDSVTDQLRRDSTERVAGEFDLPSIYGNVSL